MSRLLAAVLLATALPASAQTAGRSAAASFVRADRTLDLSALPAGTVDFTDRSVTQSPDGHLRTSPPGDYRDVSSGPTGPPLALPAYALAVAPDGTVYIGGGVDSAGGTGSYVSRWTGSAWVQVGPPFAGGVFSLAVALDGTLYAGGAFTVLRWTGTAWVPLGASLNGAVNALAAMPDGSLYVGGSFTSAGGTGARYIARWDGAAWSRLGSGATNGVNSSVSDLAVAADGSLFVGGSFTTAGTLAASGIARWTGTAWTSLGPTRVTALTAGRDGSVYGEIGSNTGSGVSVVVRWTGSAWTQLGGSFEGAIDAIAFGLDGSVYAGGEFVRAGAAAARNVARWDGAAWTPLGAGVDRRSSDADVSVRALTVPPDGRLVVGGAFTLAGGVAATHAARWDGAGWTPLGSTIFSRLYPHLAAGPDGTMYATATISTVGDGPEEFVVRWTGTAWVPFGSGFAFQPYEIAVGPDGRVYAISGGVGVVRWTGAAWEPLGGAATGGTGGPALIQALTVGPDGSVYLGGSFAAVGGVAANNVARWNGTAWQALGTGMTDLVTAIAVSPDGSVYVGGRFATPNYQGSLNHVARWTGTAWEPLSRGTRAIVQDLAVTPEGYLYAGGDFTSASGVAVNRVAMWDGGQWLALGSGVSSGSTSPVLSLAVAADGDLYIGGFFGSVGGMAANSIARWDGAAWHAMGSGITNTEISTVFDLAVDGVGDLFIGGGFRLAGGVVSVNMALYDAPAIVAGETGPDLTFSLAVGPNPASGTATAWASTADGTGVVEVFDALGRRMASLLLGGAAGRVAVPLPVAGLAPGVYVVRLRSGAGAQTARLVVTR